MLNGTNAELSMATKIGEQKMDRRFMLGSALAFAGAASVGANLRAGDKKEAENCDSCCGDCRATCLACVDSCLDEEGRKECIKLCLDCADICAICTSITSRKGPMAKEILELCIIACEKCAAECSKHADDKACQECAAACKRFANECRDVIAALK